jgi:hypothetical protein
MTVLGLAVVTGCATSKQVKYQRGEGDAGVFIVERATALGAERVSTNTLPRVYSAWQYVDRESSRAAVVKVRLPGEEREVIERVLHEAFGARQNVKLLLFDALPGGPALGGVYLDSPSPVRIELYIRRSSMEVVLMRWMRPPSNGVERATPGGESEETP